MTTTITIYIYGVCTCLLICLDSYGEKSTGCWLCDPSGTCAEVCGVRPAHSVAATLVPW